MLNYRTVLVNSAQTESKYLLKISLTKLYVYINGTVDYLCSYNTSKWIDLKIISAFVIFNNCIPSHQPIVIDKGNVCIHRLVLVYRS